MSFTSFVQEPCVHAFSCWGFTLHSRTNKDLAGPEGAKEIEKDIGIKSWIRGKKEK
jgi:hypothetical protein